MITEQQLAAIETALSGLGWTVKMPVKIIGNLWTEFTATSVEREINVLKDGTIFAGKGDGGYYSNPNVRVFDMDTELRTALRAIDAVLEGEGT